MEKRASERPDDMGLPSVCYEYVLLPLVSKEVVSANGLVKPGRKSEQRYREKVGGVKEMSSSCCSRKTPASSQNLTIRPQPCGDSQINRNELM